MENKTGMEKLLAIMEQLRSAKGCPWDRQQTMVSLKPFVIEEAYEVIEAIDSGDKGKVCEELGDLLLQIVFQAQIGKEESSFSFEDVVEGINEKLLRRHPHVFGDEIADTAEEVLHRWGLKNRKRRMRRGVLFCKGHLKPCRPFFGPIASRIVLHESVLIGKRRRR